MTTKEVADKFGLERVTLCKWCKKNGIKRKMGVNGIMEYNITEKDVEKFKRRTTMPGPKKGTPKKKKINRQSS